MQDNFFQIINLLKYKLLARHRKGFSVHSPFVFELLNNVFFEKEHYYCYEEIEKIVAKNRHKNLFFNKLKYYKLFFRLANYFNAQKILIVGKNNFIEKIFTFVSSKTQVFYAENIEKIEENDFDLIFFTEGTLEAMRHCGRSVSEAELLDPKSPKSSVIAGLTRNLQKKQEIPAFAGMTVKAEMTDNILIFENIYQNKEINDTWKNICNDNKLKISIDIFRYGIIINKNDIPKQHYRVAF